MQNLLDMLCCRLAASVALPVLATPVPQSVILVQACVCLISVGCWIVCGLCAVYYSKLGLPQCGCMLCMLVPPIVCLRAASGHRATVAGALQGLDQIYCSDVHRTASVL
jgi:hypothetical protein